MQMFLLLTGMNKESTFGQLLEAVPVIKLEDNEKLVAAIKAAGEQLVPHLNQWYSSHSRDTGDEKARLADAHRLKDVFEYLLKVAIRDGPIRQKFLEHPGSLYKNTFFLSGVYMAWAECDEVKECIAQMENPVPSLHVPAVMKEFCVSILRKQELQYERMLDGIQEIKEVMRKHVYLPVECIDRIDQALDGIAASAMPYPSEDGSAPDHQPTAQTAQRAQSLPESGSETGEQMNSSAPGHGLSVSQSVSQSNRNQSSTRCVRFASRASIGLRRSKPGLPILIPTPGKVRFEQPGDMNGAKYGFELVEAFFREGLS